MKTGRFKRIFLVGVILILALALITAMAACSHPDDPDNTVQDDGNGDNGNGDTGTGDEDAGDDTEDEFTALSSADAKALFETEFAFPAEFIVDYLMGSPQYNEEYIYGISGKTFWQRVVDEDYLTLVTEKGGKYYIYDYEDGDDSVQEIQKWEYDTHILEDGKQVLEETAKYIFATQKVGAEAYKLRKDDYSEEYTGKTYKSGEKEVVYKGDAYMDSVFGEMEITRKFAADGSATELSLAFSGDKEYIDPAYDVWQAVMSLKISAPVASAVPTIPSSATEIVTSEPVYLYLNGIFASASDYAEYFEEELVTSGVPGQQITLPELVKLPYDVPIAKFEGWYYDSDCTIPVENGTVTLSSENCHLYPKLAITDMTVDLDGGYMFEEDLAELNSCCFLYELNNSQPVKAGYYFAGWGIGDGKTPVDDYIEQGNVIRSDGMKLTALWIKCVKISFDTNVEGLNCADRYVCKEDDHWASELPTLNPEGKYFIGWFKDEALTQPVDENAAPEEDTVFYAKYADALVVYFNDEGAGMTMPKYVNFPADGEIDELLDEIYYWGDYTTIPKGMILEAWLMENGQPVDNLDSYPTSNLVLTPKFGQPYSVILHFEYDDVTFDYNSKEGYDNVAVQDLKREYSTVNEYIENSLLYTLYWNVTIPMGDDDFQLNYYLESNGLGLKWSYSYNRTIYSAVPENMAWEMKDIYLKAEVYTLPKMVFHAGNGKYQDNDDMSDLNITIDRLQEEYAGSVYEYLKNYSLLPKYYWQNPTAMASNVDGEVFYGWSLTETGDVVDLRTLEMTDGELNLYAQYKPFATVTFALPSQYSDISGDAPILNKTVDSYDLWALEFNISKPSEDDPGAFISPVGHIDYDADTGEYVGTPDRGHLADLFKTLLLSPDYSYVYDTSTSSSRKIVGFYSDEALTQQIDFDCDSLTELPNGTVYIKLA